MRKIDLIKQKYLGLEEALFFCISLSGEDIEMRMPLLKMNNLPCRVECTRGF